MKGYLIQISNIEHFKKKVSQDIIELKKIDELDMQQSHGVATVKMKTFKDVYKSRCHSVK